jgi:DNA repair exonuclease SbcCD nuclease subunit
MKRIALADIHLSAYKDDPIASSGLPQRLHDLVGVIRTVCKFARTNKIGTIDVLGDLHHDKNIIFTDAQNAFKDIIVEFPDLTFEMFSGNHDLSSTGDYQTSAISAFEGYPNVNCYTQPVVIDNITIIPYSNQLVKHIHEAEPNDILLSHFGLSEGQLQSGLSIISDVKMSNLAKFKLVLLGHYHLPQKIENEQTILYYVGSPIHTSWNDKNQKKRFIVYDTETLEIASLPLKGFQEYRELNIVEGVDQKELLEEASTLREQGHRVKVRNKTKDKVDATNSGDMIVIEEGGDIDITQRGLSTEMTTVEQMTKFLELKEIPEDKRELYLNIGKRCIDGSN